MSNVYQSLSHSRWDCKYHVVFIPKRRRKVLFGRVRLQLGEVFHALARQKECQILEGHLKPDHVHMCIAIPPKYPVASVIGFLKGKSATAFEAAPLTKPPALRGVSDSLSVAGGCSGIGTEFRRSGEHRSPLRRCSPVIYYDRFFYPDMTRV